MRKNIINNLVAFAGARRPERLPRRERPPSTGSGTGTGSGDGSGTGSGDPAAPRAARRAAAGPPAARPAAVARPAAAARRRRPIRTWPRARSTTARRCARRRSSSSARCRRSTSRPPVTDATSYSAQLDKYLADPRFALQIKSYFSDMMKMGGTLAGRQRREPRRSTSASTRRRPSPPSWSSRTSRSPTSSRRRPTPARRSARRAAFTDAACAVANGLTTAGILTDPGAMAQFFSNMAFRRVRWIQETFVCTQFPTEFSATPVAMGNGAVHVALAVRVDHRRRDGADQLPGHVVGHLRELPHDDEPHRAAVRAASTRGRLPDDDSGAHADAGRPDHRDGRLAAGDRRASPGASAPRSRR